MELAELELAWVDFSAEVIEADRVDESVLLDTVHQKSRAEISKIKRGLYLKFVAASCVLTGLLLVTGLNFRYPVSFNFLDFVFSPVETQVFLVTVSISIATMIYFNYRAYKKIKTVQASANNLKASLQGFISAMENAINFNIYSDTLLTPIIVVWVYYAKVYDHQPLVWELKALALIIIPVLTGTFSYFFQRFMQYLKFGKYVDRLKKHLTDLED